MKWYWWLLIVFVIIFILLFLFIPMWDSPSRFYQWTHKSTSPKIDVTQAIK